MLTIAVAILAAQLSVPVVDVVSVYDGDTIRVHAAPWPGVQIETSVRVAGVDTPEIRGRCPAERSAAIAARDFVRELLAGAGDVALLEPIHGLYAGRVVADVLIDGESLSRLLLAAGHGRPYDGQTARQPWC